MALKKFGNQIDPALIVAWQAKYYLDMADRRGEFEQTGEGATHGDEILSSEAEVNG